MFEGIFKLHNYTGSLLNEIKSEQVYMLPH